MNSFIPLKGSNTMIVDGRIDGPRLEMLEKLGQRVIKTSKCDSVQEPVSYHPDIVLHPVNHNTLVVAPDVFYYYSEIFKKDDIKLIEGERYLGYNYPNDIAYNVGRVGNYAIHNWDYTDHKLRYYLEKEGLEFINVRQGYSKCSLGLLGDKAAITSDRGIYESLREKNIDILLVENGYIRLEGYSYGFIGGSMGNLDENRVILTGNLSSHIDGEKIEAYVTARGKKIIELSKGEIVDLGSLIGLSL